MTSFRPQPAVPFEQEYLDAAVQQAKLGLDEGGIPTGAVLVHDGKIIGRGRNRRVQDNSVIKHALMDCLENAGRLSSTEYRRSVIYTTLSPCTMCAGALLLYKIPQMIIGENLTLSGNEQFLVHHGVTIEVVDDKTCMDMMEAFVKENPKLWLEDIGCKKFAL